MRSKLYPVAGLALAFTAGLLAGKSGMWRPGEAMADATPAVRRNDNGITVANLARDKSYVLVGFRSTSRERPSEPSRPPAAPDARRPPEPGGVPAVAPPVTFEAARNERIYVLEVASIWRCLADEPCDPCRVGECTFPPEPPAPPFSPYAAQARLVGIVGGHRDAPGR